MELLNQIADIFLHLDQHLGRIIEDYGALTYLVLFLIIFIETGVVVMPFLPGDSLLFAAGMMAAKYSESLNIWLIIGLLLIAAILGDTCNYLLGKRFGTQALRTKLFGRPVIKPEHVAHTHSFYEKYGPSTIVIARFVPIVRTLAPFVAGIAVMDYRVFFKYNVIGGMLWVIGLTVAGYFLGSIPLVRDNFEKVIMGIILMSVLPIIWQFFRKNLSPA
ncbi:Protein DedA [Dyadobacter sp. CECT 9623]|uniref:Protein DedA n=1 Tax=Dyadobacter linearis TaxID=2823330 RepID=A0ABN7REZ7_9BACT|nr:VTT domain-containing protein [Dyadobacter sp. CECT 9623]CAG5074711.1 Protein DedA [Dyadobacter sp. CECT 9623]